MKKIACILLLSFFSASAFGQDYYTGKETVSADGTTFKVSSKKYIFSLRNINNEKDEDPKLYYKDGRLLEDDYLEVQKAATVPGCVEQAYVATFSKEEYLKFKEADDDFDVSYVFTPEGETIEVAFIISKSPGMLSVPPSKFALLEKNLKKYVKWEVTSLGKQLKYMYGFSFARFSKMTLRYPGDPLPEVGGGHLDIKDPNKPGLLVD